jgi:hypothetical protein
MHEKAVSSPSRVPDYAVAAMVVLVLVASAMLFMGMLAY